MFFRLLCKWHTCESLKVSVVIGSNLLIWGKFGTLDIPTILKFYITSGIVVRQNYMRNNILLYMIAIKTFPN